MIDVDAEGRVAIQGKTLESNDEATIQNTLGGIIKNLGVEDMPVTVNADGNCKQKDIIAIMNACSQIGIKRMRVATIQTTNY
jgi:biopolymer transport protein ExbD